MSSEHVTTGELAKALERRFPAAWAEEWDNVGLVAGERADPVRGVLVTLDATAEAVERAVAAGANVLVTHHPPYLGAPTVVRAAGAAGALEAAVRLGVAIIALHTNLDRSPEGASALPEALGLTVLGPLESSTQKVSLIVTYAPPTAVVDLVDAMAAAGAGRVGNYERAAFTVAGEGSFTALPGAEPAVPDDGTGVSEVRIEMIAPRASAPRVLEAARAAHPYEEPVILALEAERARGVARLGRVCAWREGASLASLAAHVGATLGVSCRVWGEPGRVCNRIAVGNGSAGSLIADASAVADVMIAGEVRYHDALAAVASGLAIIEAGHDCTEWPMVPVLAGAVSAALPPGLPVITEQPSAGWWTMEEPDV